MILDTSAIVAILQGEPEAEEFAALIEGADRLLISAATALEASIVLGRARQEVLDEFRTTAGAQVEPVDAVQLSIARDGYQRYGRGSGSAARLNFGDCFSYALAIATDLPLLFKGSDFVHTDVRVAAVHGD
ncbi:MAG TPA: type II toxin-antitoxin system VapC family toxin [Jiangellaceae bacterium]|nr:type II toxin-antitoxin system VapC family toxin [Jiangellaceae bacterium]